MVRLYPKVVVKGQSFVGEVKQTVPRQTLSLREILRRYVRNEPLPGTKGGIYEERFGDLEKMSKMDMVDQMDKVEELKGQIAEFERRQKDREEKQALAKKERIAKKKAQSVATETAPEGKAAQKPAPQGP